MKRRRRWGRADASAGVEYRHAENGVQHGCSDASVRPDIQALATAILLNRLIKFREVYLKIKQSKYNLEQRECTTLKHLTSKYG